MIQQKKDDVGSAKWLASLPCVRSIQSAGSTKQQTNAA